MGILEDVTSMSNQGISEEEIVTNLREKGISPKEIKDAFNQQKIKNAISDFKESENDMFADQTETNNQQVQEQEAYVPQGQTYSYPQQDYAPQEGYENYPQSAGVDANTIIEISEQVFSEKIKILQKELDSFSEFKSLNQIRMENLNERLKRIETVFDKLQITILEKIGSYGQNLELIKKEMNMVQDSFSKIVEPMVENAEKRQEGKKVYSPRKKRTKKK
jgi:hypothetical protein